MALSHEGERVIPLEVLFKGTNPQAAAKREAAGRTVYSQFLTGGEVDKDIVSWAWKGAARGDLRAFLEQGRLEERVEGSQRFVRLLPKK